MRLVALHLHPDDDDESEEIWINMDLVSEIHGFRDDDNILSGSRLYFASYDSDNGQLCTTVKETPAEIIMLAGVT